MSELDKVILVALLVFFGLLMLALNARIQRMFNLLCTLRDALRALQDVGETHDAQIQSLNLRLHALRRPSDE